MKSFIVSFFILLSGFVIYKTFSFLNFIYSRASMSDDAVIIDVSSGESFSEVSLKLYKEGIIKSHKNFLFLAKIQKAYKKVKVGEFKFNKNMTPLEVMDRLIKGKVLTYSFTIPEGYNMYQIAEVLASKGMIDNTFEFIKACKDKDFVKSLGLSSDTVEGYLYPNTYSILKKTGAREIIKIMFKEFNRIFTEEFEHRALELRFTKNQIVVLASIIEKETGASSERALISSVFHNRLKNNMKLQSDPTTIYGIWETYKGNLTKKDLNSYSSYNTYYIFGLPKGAIASPGKEAIVAALYPEQSEYLYFVSKNDGTHVFSSNYRNHNKAVFEFQKTRQNRVGKSWRDYKESN